MTDREKPKKTSDKMIDEFKERADKSVQDARKGKTEDNPVKETIRDHPESVGCFCGSNHFGCGD